MTGMVGNGWKGVTWLDMAEHNSKQLAMAEH